MTGGPYCKKCRVAFQRDKAGEYVCPECGGKEKLNIWNDVIEPANNLMRQSLREWFESSHQRIADAQRIAKDMREELIAIGRKIDKIAEEMEWLTQQFANFTRKDKIDEV